ncbi:MAG: ferredoxin reductase family protein [Candidatus Krumholzibacteriota bacterium]
MASAAVRILIYLLIALLPLAVLSFTNTTYYGLLAELGRSSALVGFMILAMQSLLAGRFKWITRPFGFDIVIRFHRNMAILAVCLIILHPVLLAAGSSGFDLLYSLSVPWYISVGRGALLLLVLIALFSMAGNPDRLGFERWRLIHDITTPLLLILVIIHAWMAGTDFATGWVKWGAVIISGISLAAYIYHRFIRPAMLSGRPYLVSGVDEIAAGVWDIALKPPDGDEVFGYLPGQFQFITFHRAEGLPEEEHHWTISSSPAETGLVRSTIKNLGDFTSTMGETRTGDTATVHAPFGRFSYVLRPNENDFVFIAGGIGITPMMGMIRHMRDTGRPFPVLLVYANRNLESAAFREELARIEEGKAPSLRVIDILSDPAPDWDGETGYLDADKLERYCHGRFEDRAFYVSGPPPMVSAARKAIEEKGVPDRMVHTEVFSFLD